MILGIIAIVFSTQADTKYNGGDYDGALENAKRARTLALIAIGLFAVGLIINVIMIIVGGMDSVIDQYKGILKYAE
jgi:uncharacterized membrane protein YiaA